MSEQVELTNPVDLSVGGMSGHIFRRFFHLAMFIIPVLYFEYGEDVADKVGMTLDEVVATFVLVAVIGEITPTKEYAYPLIFSLTFGDPFMGELRRKGMDSRSVIIAACVFLIGIWLACWYAFGTPIIVCLIVAPIAVLAETPRLRYIDDNATMLLIPLAAVVTLEPFFNLL